MSEQHRDDDHALDVFGPLKDGPEHVRQIIEKVLTLEQEHLFQRPHVSSTTFCESSRTPSNEAHIPPCEQLPSV